jgi:tRNA(Ile2) C34 agmatinyltransferase TiaS
VTTTTLSESVFAPAGGKVVTLDERVVALLEELALRERARCPVCEGELVATGHCRDCGSSLR